jgi:hypothetical protein
LILKSAETASQGACFHGKGAENSNDDASRAPGAVKREWDKSPGLPVLSTRMGMRRMTRLRNGFSKKWENLRAAYALWFAFFNFCRIHKT